MNNNNNKQKKQTHQKINKNKYFTPKFNIILLRDLENKQNGANIKSKKKNVSLTLICAATNYMVQWLN